MSLTGHAHSSRVEFEALYRRNHRLAFRLAYRLTGNRTDAEDLTQDAFVRAWGSFHLYDRRLPFMAWLRHILSNAAIDRWRRRPSAPTYSLDQTCGTDGMNAPLGSLVPDHAPGPEQQCIHEVVGERIQAALELLPPYYRTTIVLADIEGRSYEEVAERMQCPLGTVRSRLHRAHVALRKELSSPETALND